MNKFVGFEVGIVLSSLLFTAANAGLDDGSVTKQDEVRAEYQTQKEEAMKTDQHFSRRNKAMIRMNELRAKKQAKTETDLKNKNKQPLK